jgi:hypothetical protein
MRGGLAVDSAWLGAMASGIAPSDGAVRWLSAEYAARALRVGLDPYMVGDDRRRFAVASVIDAMVNRAILD